MERGLGFQLVALFLLSQLAGLWVAGAFLDADLRAELYSEDANDPLNAAFLLAYIIAVTAVLLVAIRFLKRRHSQWFLKLFELLAVFATGVLVFSTVLSPLFALLVTLAIVGHRVFRGESIWGKNLASLVATVGAGALLGISIGVVPAALFVAALAIYDFVAVFKTRHMVTLARAVTQKNLAFTFSLPTKKHTFQLGTGDLVIPLMFASSALTAGTGAGLARFVPGLAVMAGSILGLWLTLEYGSRHVGRALPALPLQAVLMIAFLALVLLAGF